MTAAIPQPQLAPPNIGQALSIYQSVDGATANAADGQAGAGDFGAVLGRALEGVIATGQQADAQSMQAVAGSGDITSVVTAVSRAQLALQTTVAIRDRVLQAYQDIIKMPI